LLYLQQRQPKQAADAFQKALAMNPNYPEAHYSLGTVWYGSGNLDEALKAFRRSAESNPNYPNAYYGAGLVFLHQGKYADAQRVLQYARDLFNAQRNTQWANSAAQLLQQVQSAASR
jgi:tetratricopeptide (TPR) repeat protein